MILEIDKVGTALKEELAATVSENIDISLFFRQNKNDLIEVALFGGAIRDMFLFGYISKESDLDLIISGLSLMIFTFVENLSFTFSLFTITFYFKKFS